MSPWMAYFISSFLFSLLVKCSLSILFFSNQKIGDIRHHLILAVFHWSLHSYLKTWSPGPCSSLQQKELGCHLNEHLFMTMTTWPWTTIFLVLVQQCGRFITRTKILEVSSFSVIWYLHQILPSLLVAITLSLGLWALLLCPMMTSEPQFS